MTVEVIAGWIGVLGVLVAIAYGAYLAVGPIPHNRVIAAHREWRATTGHVVSMSPIIPANNGNNLIREDRIAYRDYQGRTHTVRRLMPWRFETGRPVAMAVGRRGEVSFKHSYHNANDPLHPALASLSLKWLVIALVVALLFGGSLVFLVQTAAIMYYRTKPRPDAPNGAPA